jgi:hypothetical protein
LLTFAFGFVDRAFFVPRLFLGSCLFTIRQNRPLDPAEQVRTAFGFNDILALKIDHVPRGFSILFANQVIGNEKREQDMGIFRILGDPELRSLG